ncbi:hypothetical protein CRG98_035358, partial [Punica granatum]
MAASLNRISKARSPYLLIRSLSTSLHAPNPSTNSGSGDDADKILKILAKTANGCGGSNSLVDASLDRASVAVTPPLVADVLKGLSNAGALALSFF